MRYFFLSFIGVLICGALTAQDFNFDEGPTPPDCHSSNGPANGRVKISPTFGTGPYDIILTGGALLNDINRFGTSIIATELRGSANPYTVRAEDDNGTVREMNFTLPEPPEIVINVPTDLKVPCKDIGSFVSHRFTASNLSGPALWEFGLEEQNETGQFDSIVAGSHIITVTDENNCSAAAAVNVSTADDAQLVILPSSPDTIRLGQSVQLQAVTKNTDTNGIKYQWTPPNRLSCSNCSNPVMSAVNNRTYVVQSTKTVGTQVCVDTASYTVIVIPVRTIFVANAFAPSDAQFNPKNARMYTKGENIRNFHLTVYSRSGVKMFESFNIDFQWDGTYQGGDAPAGVYTYVIEMDFIDGTTTPLAQKGSVTLIR